MDQTLIEELKRRARALHRGLQKGDPHAEARARRHTPAREGEPPLTAQRRHCLSVVARELGFRGWQHATAVLGGEDTDDFGTLLYPPGASAHWNIWSASYEEARSIRDGHGGYLLVYRHQYLVVDRHFLESLGVDPEDPDWDRMGRDWVRPGDPRARTRLVRRVVRGRLDAQRP